MTLHRCVSEDAPKVGRPTADALPPLVMARHHTLPNARSPHRTLPQSLPAGNFPRQRSPDLSASFRARQYTSPRNSLDSGRGQHSNVRPSMQDDPYLKISSAHKSLGTPLLQDTTAAGQQSSPLSRHTTKTCFRALAVLLLWVAAAVLGLTVAATLQATHALHAATVARPQTPLDFTLRLARTPDKCLGVVDAKEQSQVMLQACSASGTQQFLLLNDGTIRSRSDDKLCVTSVSGSKLVLLTCAQLEVQVFNVLPSGKLALKAKPSECLDLQNGDSEAGVMDLHQCSGDFNEIFIYGGGHFLAPAIEHELSKVRALPLVNTSPEQMQENLKAVCLLTLGMFILSALLMTAARPKRRYQCLYVMVLGFIAGIIFLICSSLLSATHALQESERLTENAKAVASAQAADMDFTLRMSKLTDHCLGVGSLKDKSKVSLQQCNASASQQFILQDDGTIHAKNAAEFCLTVEQQSNTVVLSPCDSRLSALQAFSKQAESNGWLQPQASPSMCLNLLRGDVKAGNIGLYQCGSDLNEVFVYSGGNVAISGMALRVHKVRLLLKQASHHLEGDFVRILALGGGACFLLLAVPSLVLLAGSAGPTSA